MSQLAEKSGRALATTAFQAIDESLRSQIAAGRWRVGEMIPSRRALAQEFGVNLETLQRGIEGLISDGILRSDNRRGTYVARSYELDAQKPKPQTATSTIGIIGPIRRLPTGEWSDDWNNIVIAAIEQTVTRGNGRSLFANTYIAEDPQGEPIWHEAEDLVPGLLAQGVDALIFVKPRQFTRSLVTYAESLPVRTVLVASAPSRNNLPCVFYDSVDGGYQAADHLIAAGWDSIAFYSPFTADWVEQRAQGAKERANQSAIKFEAIVDPQVSATQAWFEHRAFTYQAVLPTVRSGWRPRAIIAANDDIAAGLIDAFAEVGQHPGSDFGLVGFDDKLVAREMNITSFRPPLSELGSEAARIAMLKSEKSEPAIKISLHSHLIARLSSQGRR